MVAARERMAPIATPIFVQGRNGDELQGIFRVCYDLVTAVQDSIAFFDKYLKA
jgi:hypothetical protein